MPLDNDTFGPWTPPGEDGRPPEDVPGGTSTGGGEPTTPATVDNVQFWASSTLGILDTGERAPWDRCTLGQHQLPGLVHVSISKPAERKIDIKSPDGKAKAKATAKGWEPAEVTITLLLWTPPHLREWRAVRADLRDPNDDEESEPQEIVHPVTEDSAIRAIMIKRIGGIEDGRQFGTSAVSMMPHHGKVGVVVLVGRGRGPRNVAVRLDNEVVVVPRGNLRDTYVITLNPPRESLPVTTLGACAGTMAELEEEREERQGRLF